MVLLVLGVPNNNTFVLGLPITNVVVEGLPITILLAAGKPNETSKQLQLHDLKAFYSKK
jgi:hypothetical protein